MSDSTSPSETEMGSDTGLYKLACQEVDLLRVLLPSVEFECKRLGQLLSRTQVLKERFLESKCFFEGASTYLKLSSADIHRLDKETCRNLRRTIPELVSRMKICCALRSGKQLWPSSRIHLQELCQSPDPSVEVLVDDWYDHLHQKLKYIAGMYFTVLLDGHKRLEELVSKDKVQLAQLQSLRIVLEKSMNLLVLRRTDISRVNKKECRRLVKMIKLFVMGALNRNYACGDMEQVWPCKNLIAISELLQQLNMDSASDQVGPASEVGAESNEYQGPPLGGGLSEGHWQHQAYKELQTLRIVHSSKLDQAYRKGNAGVLCHMLARASDKFLRKSLEFLATPWAEFASLSKEKCYYRMMLINLYVSANQDSLHPQAAAGSSPNWRDWVYEEIRGFRKKFSPELDDEVFRLRRVACTMDPKPAKKRACSNLLLEETLNFLGYARADLAVVSMVECLGRLVRVKRFMKCPMKFNCPEAYEKFLESACNDSTYQIWPERLPYWRDDVYEEIKSKKTKFLDEFDGTCKELYTPTFQNPELAAEATKLKEVKLSLDRAVRFFTMTRSEIALVSADEYVELVESINKDLVNVKDSLASVRKMTGVIGGYPSDISRILLKKKTKSELVSPPKDYMGLRLFYRR